MKARAHVFVSGYVQAVFFRVATRGMAKRYHVNGWIRNLPDGRVEAIFEGEENDVNALVEFCNRGPPAAIVKKVEVFWEVYSGEFDDFNTI